MKNLTDALERVIQKQASDLREAAKQVSTRQMTVQMLIDNGFIEAATSIIQKSKHPSVEKRIAEHREQRIARYETVRQMRKEGFSISAISRQTGLHRETIRRFLCAERYPERAPAYCRPSKVVPYDNYLRKRWAEGCFNSRKLYKEIKAQGYQGCQVSVRRYLHSWPTSLPSTLRKIHALPDFTPPSPRQAVWWLLKKDDLEPMQKEYVYELERINPKIKTSIKLVNDFKLLLNKKAANQLEQWISLVRQSDLPDICSFADGLLKDEAAVKAAMTYEWSNGQVEGQVNRLKMIKRSMYGRAKMDLLRSRVMYAP